MKLYYLPGACSLASHIMLREVGADFEIVQVDPAVGRTASGEDYRAISPNGYVPALDIGHEVLTEGVAVMQHIADRHPDKAFSPALGSVARARLQQFLNFAAAELHKSWSPLFSDQSTEDEKAAAASKVASKFDYLESELSDGREFLVENRFSAADAYTFVLANWANVKAIDLKAWPNLAGFVDRIMARPTTQAAMLAEGLI
ncbi:MAG: glutathione transferase GstA [Pseudomonadota bacterium]